MSKETRQAIKLILNFISGKQTFYFWLSIRALSVLLPPISLYLFSRVIHCLEFKCPTTDTQGLLFFTIISYVIYNFLKVISMHRLHFLTNRAECDIQGYLVDGLHTKTNKKRHTLIQSIRNFSEAARQTMEVLLNPGIDGIVSLFYLPILVLLTDFRVFIIQGAFILVYYFTDIYTTDHYKRRRDELDKSIEDYYAKLQDSNTVDTENTHLILNYASLSHWNIIEWLTLDNIATVFYGLSLVYLVASYLNGEKEVSQIILLASYFTSTRVFMEAITSVKDKLTDTKVALRRLLRSKHYLSLDFEDLVQ